MKLDTFQRDARLSVLEHSVHWVRNNSPRQQDRNRKTRIYVRVSETFNAVEDLQNRTRRPYEAWRAPVLAVLAELGYHDLRLRWSQKAGCACSCSPGFIVEDGQRYGLRGGDLHIVLTGAPGVDESKPARQI